MSLYSERLKLERYEPKSTTRFLSTSNWGIVGPGKLEFGPFMVLHNWPILKRSWWGSWIALVPSTNTGAVAVVGYCAVALVAVGGALAY